MSRQGANLPNTSPFWPVPVALGRLSRGGERAAADLPVLSASRAFRITAAACHKGIHGATERHLTCTVTWKPSGSWALISFLAGLVFFFLFFVPALQ